MEYFTLDQLRGQFTELLQSYRQYHLRSLHDDGMLEDERRDLEDKAKVAQDTFHAAFRNHLAQNEQFLLDNSEATVLQTMLTWARNSGLPLTESDSADLQREIFSDASSCSDRLTELTSEPNSLDEFSVWPFIQKIKVYLNAYILSKGLILVDLPGLRDLNSARLKITERYLLNCDEIFAICYIGRATTDAGVMGVFELARRASLSRIGIICTKSDDILAEEAQRDWDGDSRRIIRNLIRDIENMQRSLDTNEARIRDLDADNDSDVEMDSEEREELLELHTASRKLKLKSYLITTRNQKVTDALQATYQNRIPGGNLPVFCVSNFEYWEHRTTPKMEALPFLRLSGILEVRKYCLSLVAEGQLCAAIEYMTVAIPALLGSVELWVQSGSGSLSAERKQAIRNTLEEIEGVLDTDNVRTIVAKPHKMQL
ncbi:uncharacterized protein A1O9_01657 [Exophiala aquamarina CBS 119918]|uniref:Uncharacterized protein n=1 Tax=Exophiala aquamarina CBS 119918 TaxID=1182545 RepID=A0A072PUA6_9EURO|nr:uncharacterized protein A1O9_01657 [Exophiala aquamarina CBS 119918]KEF63679.1 hypothetical protein A1O9_01657 [Exophiala aquamarina CBS 119918]